MKIVFSYLWQLPQNLMGLCLWGILKILNRIISVDRHHKLPGIIRVIWIRVPNLAVSLGSYIFVDTRYHAVTVMHEYGHSIQSRRWGPLYLPVIGVLSAIFCNLWDDLFHRKWDIERRLQWYYSRFPENHADILAGIKRETYEE
jgi:hypothetical protein